MPESQPLAGFLISTPHPADYRVKDGGCCLKSKPHLRGQVVEAESQRGHRASPRGCGRKTGSGGAKPPNDQHQ